MPSMQLLLLGLLTAMMLYASFVLALIVVGRRAEARALGGFVPDCLVLFRRLLGDARVPRAPKLAVALGIAYLALPFDLVPDFIPVAGQLDDVVIVVLVLRFAVRGGGPGLLEEHWPGPPRGRSLIHRLAFGGSAASRPA